MNFPGIPFNGQGKQVHDRSCALGVLCNGKGFGLIGKNKPKPNTCLSLMRWWGRAGGAADPAAPPPRASTQLASLRATTVKLSLVVTARLPKYQVGAQTTQESATRSAHTHRLYLVAADVMSLF